VVADAADGPRAIECARRHHPHIAVIDIGMKPMNGIEVTTQILRHSPETAVLILTVYNHQHYVVRSLEAGARGYLLKDSLDEEEFVSAIRELRTGGRHFAASIAPLVPEKFCAGGRAG
jgi:DNA-binding NarL/FixJ family response regulator